VKAIEVKDLSKVYKGGIRAVDGISFGVDEGAVFGFLGPNGAGKSTTIKILVTLIQASAGKGFIFGLDVAKDPAKVREMIGYVPQEISSDGALTGYENMLLSAKLYDLPVGERRERIEELLAMFGLSKRAHDIVKTYSGGMIRRLEIGQAMLHNPRILFLDEPTLGLDPSGRKLVWEHIRKINKEKGITIFLTTHYMEEADSLCTNVGIINRGKIAVVDSPTALRETVGLGTLTLALAFNEGVQDQKKYLESMLHGQVNSIVQLANSKWQITVKEVPHNAPKILQRLAENKIQVTELDVKSPTLEDAFIKFTGTKLGEEPQKEDWKATRGRRRTFRRMG
jgi:ABC-2 type transport system ATP-binding protein